MLEKQITPYAVTRLTQQGRKTSLTDNSSFEFVQFAFIDDEVNYNLFNADQKLTKGFDRLDQEEDRIADILSLAIKEPVLRSPEINEYLFGNTVEHQLEADDIKTENDLIIDMSIGKIVKAQETIDTQQQRKIDISFQPISGIFPFFILKDNDFVQWSTLVDIRTMIHEFNSNGITPLFEEYSGISSIKYVVAFSGTHQNEDKEFLYDVSVQPNQPIIIEGKRIIEEFGLLQYYGTFFVTKEVVINGIKYTSKPVTIPINRTNSEFEIPTLDGYKEMLQKYSLPYVRKNILMAFDYKKSDRVARLYNIYANDIILKQSKIKKYVDLAEPIKFDVKSSNINQMNLMLRNIASGKTYSLISLISTKIDAANNLLTIPSFSFSFLLTRQLTDAGYYLQLRTSFPESFGFLEGEQIGRNEYDYYFFRTQALKIAVSGTSSIFLGQYDTNDTLDEKNRLWQLYCEDHSLLFNYTTHHQITLDDYENLLLYL